MVGREGAKELPSARKRGKSKGQKGDREPAETFGSDVSNSRPKAVKEDSENILFVGEMHNREATTVSTRVELEEKLI